MKTKLLTKIMLLLCALVAGSGSVWADNYYVKVTQESDLTIGATYVFLADENSNHYLAVGDYAKRLNTATEGFSISGNVLTVTTATPFEVVLGGKSGAYTMLFTASPNNKYLGKGSANTEFSSSTSSTSSINQYTWNYNNNGLYSNYKDPGKSGKDHTNRYIGLNSSTPAIGPYNNTTSYPIASLYKKVVPAAISSVGWTTFVSVFPLDFTDYTDANAYMVTGASGSSLTLSPVTGTVPAETPLLLSGDNNETVYIPAVANSETNVSANKLKKGTGASINEATKYVLVARDSKAVFAPTDANAATVPVGKAYLDLEGVSLARGFVLDDSETTGIQNINSESKGFFNGEFYNLSGQRVTKPGKGLYIVNGKKVIIK